MRMKHGTRLDNRCSEQPLHQKSRTVYISSSVNLLALKCIKEKIELTFIHLYDGIVLMASTRRSLVASV